VIPNIGKFKVEIDTSEAVESVAKLRNKLEALPRPRASAVQIANTALSLVIVALQGWTIYLLMVK
jgi:hypothetical protein